MIPLKLELEGIYSYKEKQVIDFDYECEMITKQEI